MKVKAIDIARELGISKATVSLALNNRQGVSEHTRAEVLLCKKKLEEKECSRMNPENKMTGNIIRVVVASRNLQVVRDPEMDLWTDVIVLFDQVAKSWGCSLEVVYFNLLQENAERMCFDCNRDNICGIILFGTELYPEDAPLFQSIQKPVIVYDTDLRTKRYAHVIVNNSDACRMAVEYLLAHGKKRIVYLRRNKHLYNYEEKQRAFRAVMTEHNLLQDETEQLVCMGDTINTIYENMKKYLDTHPLPDAFLTKSYHLSIGCLRAFRDKKIAVPSEVSIIGVDRLPDYLTGDKQLTTIQVPHTERAMMVMSILWHEIHDSSPFKSKVYTNCRLIEGETVS